MNILLIGNGFDLAHRMPTKYTDFLEFVKIIRNEKLYSGKQYSYSTIKMRIMNDYRLPMNIRWEISECFVDKLRKKSEEIEELQNLITDNF